MRRGEAFGDGKGLKCEYKADKFGRSRWAAGETVGSVGEVLEDGMKGSVKRYTHVMLGAESFSEG
jgi:hypothetical protein